MIDQNKHQYWQYPNELLIKTDVNSMNKKINPFYKRNINAESKKDKMNDSSKQTWTLTTTKLIIAQNKYQC